jgi:hypothetical protein
MEISDLYPFMYVYVCMYVCTGEIKCSFCFFRPGKHDITKKCIFTHTYANLHACIHSFTTHMQRAGESRQYAVFPYSHGYIHTHTYTHIHTCSVLARAGNMLIFHTHTDTYIHSFTTHMQHASESGRCAAFSYLHKHTYTHTHMQRAGESGRYAAFSRLPNKMLLFKGTRMTSVASVLSQGLRTPPAEAPTAAYILGIRTHIHLHICKNLHISCTHRTRVA